MVTAIPVGTAAGIGTVAAGAVGEVPASQSALGSARLMHTVPMAPIMMTMTVMPPCRSASRGAMTTKPIASSGSGRTTPRREPILAMTDSVTLARNA